MFARPWLWLALLGCCLAGTSHGNAVEPLSSGSRSIIDFRRNGIRVDVKVVPAVNVSTGEEDGFPQFPFKEVGSCVLEFSFVCVQKRVARFLDDVSHLREITLFGQSVKLVKLKEVPPETISERRMIEGPSERIDRSIDDFFDMFALRISLPRWNGKTNQIDVTMDDSNGVVEGIKFVIYYQQKSMLQGIHILLSSIYL